MKAPRFEIARHIVALAALGAGVARGATTEDRPIVITAADYWTGGVTLQQKAQNLGYLQFMERNPKMWTIMVWLFSFQGDYGVTAPYLAMASFVVASVPLLLVFLFCQRIILRGIIIPSMK